MMQNAMGGHGPQTSVRPVSPHGVLHHVGSTVLPGSLGITGPHGAWIRRGRLLEVAEILHLLLLLRRLLLLRHVTSHLRLSHLHGWLLSRRSHDLTLALRLTLPRLTLAGHAGLLLSGSSSSSYWLRTALATLLLLLHSLLPLLNKCCH